MKRALLILPAILLCGCIAIDFDPFDRYRSDFHYTCDLKPGARLNLENMNGSVEITGWDEDKVDITGVKYASTERGLDEVRIDIRHEPDSIDIRTVRPSGPFRSMGARYTLRVPRKALIDRVTTSNGALRVQDLDAGGYLRTTNGAIRAENLRGDVDAQTSNGAVELHDIGGDARVRTSNGRIHAEDISGQCTAHTSNSGITIELDHAPKNGIRAESSNGTITVRLPSDAAVRVEAKTSNGSITSDFDINGNRRSVRNHLDGAIGGGGPLIELSTSNGHIGILRM